ncbi:MAG: HAMP domain-containing sensor histidine kinase [Balneolaceae bacterium]
MIRNRSLRLLFFGIGLAAVFVLTGMNVYSLFQLRESTIEAAYDHKRNQLDDFTNHVRYRFFQPFRGIRKLDIGYLQNFREKHGHFPNNFMEVMAQADKDSIFGDIYYAPDSPDPCLDPQAPLYRYHPSQERFYPVQGAVELVCDGMGLARSRMRVLIDDYRWNNKSTFDTHRSMTLSMIDPDRRKVSGHLTFLIDREYLIRDVLEPGLRDKFGDSSESGVAVWLVDYMQEEILAGSDQNLQYSRDLQIDLRQRFPDLLDNWVLHASMVDSPTILASNASLRRNLIVMVMALLALIGAFAFIYVTSRKERELIQRQSGFLANITHELKTPLSAMQAAGENLSDGRVRDPERIRTYGEHIYNETLRLRKMIDKLLDIARQDAGQTLVQRTVCDPGPLLEEVVDTHSNHLDSLGFRLNVSIPEKRPFIRVDSDHITTMLDNLIDNAVKYSNGQKQIDLELQQDDGDLMFKVRDTGIGIPAKQQKRIFEKFYRVEDAMTARTKGHGLGLSIVDHLVRLNGGTVEVESAPGTGTTFTLRFPIDTSEQADVPTPESALSAQTGRYATQG